jgi:hypothetical protein
MWKEPETNDESMQAREVFYSITPAAEEEFFRFDEQKWSRSGRVGGPLHIRIMTCLMEAYWERGYWCAFDRGDRQEPFPDILVTQPVIDRVKGREGKLASRVSTEEWSESSRTAVEIEASPAKNSEQVRINYQKNVELYGTVRFVVASRSQMPEIIRILENKDRTTFEVVVEPAGLPEDELEKYAGWRSQLSEDAPSLEPDLQENELQLLNIILSSVNSTKASLCSELGVSEKLVTGYLVHLASKGLLASGMHSYRLTEDGRKVAGTRQQTVPR